jgi:integron integrase
MAPKPRFLGLVRERIRSKHYSYRTEESYVGWIKRFIFFHNKRHPAEMGKLEMEQFLTHLAVDKNVASSTQNQALAALLFMYKEVLQMDPPWVENVTRAKKPKRLPVVLTKSEIKKLFAYIPQHFQLHVQLLYGCGLRLMELVRLRVQDIDFGYQSITVRAGKGDKDRVVMMPPSTMDALQEQLDEARRIHDLDLSNGFGEVYLPNELESRDGIICMNKIYREPLNKLLFKLTSIKRSLHIHYAIASQHTYLKTVMTFAPSKNCSDTKMSKPP